MKKMKAVDVRLQQVVRLQQPGEQPSLLPVQDDAGRVIAWASLIPTCHPDTEVLGVAVEVCYRPRKKIGKTK